MCTVQCVRCRRCRVNAYCWCCRCFIAVSVLPLCSSISCAFYIRFYCIKRPAIHTTQAMTIRNPAAYDELRPLWTHFNRLDWWILVWDDYFSWLLFHTFAGPRGINSANSVYKVGNWLQELTKEKCSNQVTKLKLILIMKYHWKFSTISITEFNRRKNHVHW